MGVEYVSRGQTKDSSRHSLRLQIPLDNPKKTPLPLCDISCGGWEMSDQSGRYPYLWGVSQQGQVSLLDHPLVAND